jgi:hypothetical protein
MAQGQKSEAHPLQALAQWRAAADRLVACADTEASGVDAWSLFLQIGLHMPRFDHTLAARDEVIDAEASRLWRRLIEIRKQAIFPPPDPANKPVLAQLELAIVPDSIAQSIHECFHYIMSYRAGSIHLGLFAADQIVPWTLISLSPFDLYNLVPDYPREYSQSTLVVSRVYAFPGAPRNAISFTLARIRRWLSVNRPEIRYFVTYLNPNLGFKGASYEADNWHLLGYEDHTRYAYLDGNYITDRRVLQLFGRTPDEILNDRLHLGVSLSTWTLQPLRLFFRKLEEGRDEYTPEPLHFDRWHPQSS